MYQGILLDVDDTLFDFAACSRAALEAVFARHRLPFDAQAYRMFREIDGWLWAEQKRGVLTAADVYDLRFAELTERLALAADAAALSVDFRAFLSEQCVMQADTPEVLRALCARVPLFIASNGTLEMQKRRLRLAGIDGCFAACFVSDDIGFEKPDPHFFEVCCRRSGLAPGDLLMVGDSLTADIAGAAAAGIDACWYCPQREAPPDGAAPKYVITRLVQLLPLVGIEQSAE